jgi:hypothetical protein
MPVEQIQCGLMQSLEKFLLPDLSGFQFLCGNFNRRAPHFQSAPCGISFNDAPTELDPDPVAAGMTEALHMAPVVGGWARHGANPLDQPAPMLGSHLPEEFSKGKNALAGFTANQASPAFIKDDRDPGKIGFPQGNA